MNKRLMAFFIAALLLVAMPMGLYAELVDRIVAVVNDEPITQSELDSLLLPIYEQYKAAYQGTEFASKMNEARTNLLNQLIEDRLVAQEAKNLGVQVTEEEINAQIEDVKTKFASEKDFYDFLAQQRITLDSLRSRYEEQISIRKLHQFEVRQKIVVSPLDIEEYYEQHSSDYTENEKIKVRTIMLRKRKDDQDVSVDAKNRIENIAQQLKHGADFIELAKQYSEGMHAAEGGDLGFIKRGEMIEEFDNVLFGLSVGGVSSVLETERGYHIFVVEAKQAQTVKPLEEVKDEIRNIVFRQKSKDRFDQWMGELKENAYISIK